MPASFRISVDCGGTFTDGILLADDGQQWTAKADTTPQDPRLGTLTCIELLAQRAGMPLGVLLGATRTIVLGTTLATNIVATRSGARTGAITTRGFRDRLSFLHVAKSDLGGDRKATPAELFTFRSAYPEPLAPRRLVVEVDERIDFQGRVLRPLQDSEVREVAHYLRGKGVEAIAVNLLFSHLNPAHEERVARILAEEYAEAHVALSSRVLPVVGEVSRWSTTLFSAYVAPRTTQFVRGIGELLGANGFCGELAFMQSNGGVASGDVVCENPAALLISGPAAGPALGLRLARPRGITNLVTTDMGGTSFDIAIIDDGQVHVTRKKIIDGKRFGLTSVDVNAVGAGGGSIASVDNNGRLQVGPASAGARPGPACYGLGGRLPTVTDANLVLGYLDCDFFLGGERRLHRELAAAAIREQVADPLGLELPQAAAAIHDVVNAKMAGAIDIMFSRRGCDPREFTLCAAGGAGALHAARLAREVGMKGFFVPRMAPVFCAFGMMHADLTHDYTRPYAAETQDADLGRMDGLFEEMEREARLTLEREGARTSEVVISRSLDMRYYGQVREQNVPVPDGPLTAPTLAETIRRFHAGHERVIGYAEPGYPTVIARLHLYAVARTVRPPALRIGASLGGSAGAVKHRRPAFFSELGGFLEVEVFDGERFGAGDSVAGPCIIEERMTTLVLPPGVSVRLEADGTYVA